LGLDNFELCILFAASSATIYFEHMS